jgi:hypothetical protein
MPSASVMIGSAMSNKNSLGRSLGAPSATSSSSSASKVPAGPTKTYSTGSPLTPPPPPLCRSAPSTALTLQKLWAAPETAYLGGHYLYSIPGTNFA